VKAFYLCHKVYKMKHKLLAISLLIVLVIFSATLFAQCPMCGEAARTSLKEGNNTAKGLNDGIVYLLAGPYILLAAGGFIWWNHRRKVRRMNQSV
jgi:flagellar basal body-associated protein FliL